MCPQWPLEKTLTDDSERSCQRTLQALQADREHKGHRDLEQASPVRLQYVESKEWELGWKNLFVHPDDGDRVDGGQQDRGEADTATLAVDVQHVRVTLDKNNHEQQSWKNIWFEVFTSVAP